MKIFLFLVCLAIGSGCFAQTNGSGSPAQTTIGHQLVDQFRIDANGARAYGLTWLPEDYPANPKKEYPLIIFLHGKGESGTGVAGLNKLIETALPQRIADGFQPSAVNPRDGKTYSFIVVSPQAPDWSYRYQQVRYILADVLKRYRIDPTRIYVTGNSAGGEGAWSCVTNDSSFARSIAAIVTCSSTDLSYPAEEKSVRSISARYGVKVWSLAGENDGLTGITRRYIDMINGAKPEVPAKFTYIEKIGHSAWNEAFNPVFRPRKSYYGASAAYASVVPDDDGSPVAGQGPDSLNVYEWLLLYTSHFPVPPLVATSVAAPAKAEVVKEGKTKVVPTKAAKAPEAARHPGPARTGQPAMRAGGCGHGNRYMITPNQDSGFYVNMNRGDGPQYHPGDTLAFSSRHNWTYIALTNYKGSNSCPLVLINSDGQTHTTTGINISGSSYVKVTGSGVKGMRYGFFMTGKNPALRGQGPFAVVITNRSKNVEVERVSIHNVGIGFDVKSEGSCEDSLNYPNWVIDSISIHDNSVVGIWNEAMYLGNTSPDNAANSYDPRPIQCGGQKIYPMPMRVGNIKVYNNYIDSTGRGGIQLASASKGMSEIYHNEIHHSGLNGDDAQGTGISVGAYTRAYIHDNTVINTFSWGIASLGGSGTGTVLRIENNRIDSSGYLVHYDLASTSKSSIDPAHEPVFPDNLPWPYPIELGTRPTLFKDSTTFWIKGNIVGKYKNRYGAIQLHDERNTITTDGNVVCGNRNINGTPATVLADKTAKREIRYSTNCR
jgi:predicted esterase